MNAITIPSGKVVDVSPLAVIVREVSKSVKKASEVEL